MPNGKTTREDKKETQPKSENLERLNASLDQVLLADVVDHKRAMQNLREQREQQAIDQKTALQNQYLENNRKTLSFLYDLEIPEAVANAIVVRAAKIITDAADAAATPEASNTN